MKIIKSNIIYCQETVIIHQVNCMNVMGSGVARALYDKWPEVKKEYHDFCEGKSPESLEGQIQIVQTGGGKVVINAFSQKYYKPNWVCHTNYYAVEQCFKQVKQYLSQNHHDRIAIPYLYGCGLGGGDWSKVSVIINKIFGRDIPVLYKLQ